LCLFSIDFFFFFIKTKDGNKKIYRVKKKTDEKEKRKKEKRKKGHASEGADCSSCFSRVVGRNYSAYRVYTSFCEKIKCTISKHLILQKQYLID